MPDLTTMEFVFWLVVILMVYTLNGYPLALRLLASFRKKTTWPPPPADGDRPMVSVIVAAYNEEKNIAAKIDNLRQINYDPAKIEVIIGSDASTDGTDRILAEITSGDDRFTVFRLDERQGKVAVLHRAVSVAKGDILVFTDCSVTTDPDFMPVVRSSFADARIGLVSSRDVWVDSADGSPVAQHQYIDYEMNIRRLESRLNSLVSASGSFFAVRKNLFTGYPAGLADDFALPLQVYRRGYRVIHRDDMVAYVPMVKSSTAELNRRIRIIQAGIRTVLAHAALLNPLRYPVFAWQLWSHKVLKWCFPYMAATAIILAAILWAKSPIYQVTVILSAVIALAGLAGFAVKSGSPVAKPFKTANFLLLSMLAAVIALFKVLSGDSSQTWEPTHR